MDLLRLTSVGAFLLVLLSRSADATSTIGAACPSDSTANHRFFTAFRAALPRDLDVARGALVIVCGKEIVFTEGFGKTAAGDAVDPARTIFRAASNSKLVAATAVMQLADRGAWRLADDVNRYLPPVARLALFANGAPVTIANLLTHTGGFEDKFAGSVVVPADRLELADYYARHTPRRVMRPGAEVSYSNVGMALAGYLVELRSGEPFARYAERHIFASLGMTRSSFDQPPPRDWLRDLAGGPPRGRYDVVFNPYPAASLVTTPVDMGRFIAAHLATTPTDIALGARVLSAEAMRLMHTPQWRAQPDAPGVAYGFFEGMINGRRTLFHTGDSGDHSLVLLLPDERVGVYFVFSGTDEQVPARERLASAFMNAFFPADDNHPGSLSPMSVASRSASPSATSRIPVSALAGTYRTSAYSRSNYEKARALFAQVTVRPGSGDAILVTPPGSLTSLTLRRTAPLTFRRDSGEVVAFRQDEAGRVVGFTLSGFIWDPSSWDRVPWIQNGRVHLLALGAAFLVLVIRSGWSPITWVVRRVRGANRSAVSPAGRRVWRWSGFVVAIFVIAPIAAAGTAFLSFSHPLRAVPRAIAVLTTLLLIAVVSGIALGPVAIAASRNADLPRPRLIIVALTAVSCTILGVVLWYWNLLMPWSLG